MAQLLQGKATAITGAVTGIGRAIATNYLRQGALAAVNYFLGVKAAEQYKSLVDEIKEDSRLTGVPGDIVQQATATVLIDATVEAFGELDVWVSNAGVTRFADSLL